MILNLIKTINLHRALKGYEGNVIPDIRHMNKTSQLHHTEKADCPLKRGGVLLKQRLTSDQGKDGEDMLAILSLPLLLH